MQPGLRIIGLEDFYNSPELHDSVLTLPLLFQASGHEHSMGRLLATSYALLRAQACCLSFPKPAPHWAPLSCSQMSCSTSAFFLSLEPQWSVSTSLTNFLYQTTAHRMNHISCLPSSSAMRQQIEIMRVCIKF